MQLNADIVEYFDIVKDSSVQKHILVHGCNCVGRYNSGLAKQIRSTYPQTYESYLEYVKNNDRRYLLGSINPVFVGESGIIVNAFTQRYYGRDKDIVYVDYRAIGKVFHSVAKMFPECAIIYPKIGAGLANGEWSEIKPIIDSALTGRFHMCFVMEK